MPTPPAPAPLAPRNGADLVRGRLMQQSLSALLDRVHGSRDVLPHLAALEQALGRLGCAAVDKVPAHWLAKVCSQLSSLPLPEDDPPLQDLLSRLLDALEAHRAKDDGFDPERTMVIREITHSEFDAATKEQATTQLGEP